MSNVQISSIKSLAPAQKSLLDLILSPNPVWLPQVGPQTLAYLSQASEVFYGGACGGGKTELILGLAINEHQHSRIFRRQYPQLRAMVERSHELLSGTDAVYNKQQSQWRYNDNVIEFAACQHEKDKEKYKGRPSDLICFDEVCDFTLSQVTFITAWNRTVVEGQRCRVILAGNPPTSSDGTWIIERYAPWLDEAHPYPAKPGELRWYAMVDGIETPRDSGASFIHEGAEIHPKSRTFIPAFLSDNAYLKDSGYEATLQALPEPLRSQLLLGLFNIELSDNPWQVIPTKWVKLAQKRWREQQQPNVPLTAVGLDPARGGKDNTVLARRYDNWFAELEKHSGRSTPDGPSVAALCIEIDKDVVIAVDVIGIGSSVVDCLIANDHSVHAINFAEGTGARDRSGKIKMRNKRSECYWSLREALDPVHGDDLALPDDPELLRDLCAPTWTLTTAGILIESKKDIKKRIGRSPDADDAVVMCHYEGVRGPLLIEL